MKKRHEFLHPICCLFMDHMTIHLNFVSPDSVTGQSWFALAGLFLPLQAHVVNGRANRHKPPDNPPWQTRLNQHRVNGNRSIMIRSRDPVFARRHREAVHHLYHRVFQHHDRLLHLHLLLQLVLQILQVVRPAEENEDDHNHHTPLTLLSRIRPPLRKRIRHRPHLSFCTRKL